MIITIKPHHYVDIIKLYGSGLTRFVPDEEYHHDFYRIGNEIVSDPNIQLQFTLKCDDICSTCKCKNEQGLCEDSVFHLPGYTSKECYNKMLDERLIQLLCLKMDRTYTSKEYCELLYAHKEVIFDVWTVEERSITKHRYELFCKGCERYLA